MSTSRPALPDLRDEGQAVGPALLLAEQAPDGSLYGTEVMPAGAAGTAPHHASDRVAYLPAGRGGVGDEARLFAVAY